VEETGYKVYKYRWVVLVVYMLITMMNQLLWITFASITKDAVIYYGVSDLSIGMLSMVFMIVFIIVSFPASWAIDTWGIRIAVGIGAALTGVFGLLRGLLGTNYTWVMISQIGIAIGQPFILNAVTTIAARWFPVKDRATAAGLGSLSIYVGILGGLLFTPVFDQAAVHHPVHADHLWHCCACGCPPLYHLGKRSPEDTPLRCRRGSPFARDGWFEGHAP